MNRELPIPETADVYQWCRWGWLMGRRPNPEALAMLRRMVLDPDRDLLIRQTALGAYWMLAEAHDAIRLEEELLGDQQWDLAVWGLNHPRWWKSTPWLDACQDWTNLNDQVNQALFRVLSWGQRPLLLARIPTEIYDRIPAITKPIDWEKMLEVGKQHVREPKSSGFVGFWEQHITEWAKKWYRWEEAVWLYRWRLQEEQQLVEWTNSEPYGARVPEVPMLECPTMLEAETTQERTPLMLLGLGWHLGSSDKGAAWDSIWSSWAASLNYSLFEILTNVQTTEWHLAGLTGSIRDQSRSQRWGLQWD